MLGSVDAVILLSCLRGFENDISVPTGNAIIVHGPYDTP